VKNEGNVKIIELEDEKKKKKMGRSGKSLPLSTSCPEA
jgi:hypothetical protein